MLGIFYDINQKTPYRHAANNYVYLSLPKLRSINAIFSCVIEEEGLQLHFDLFVLGCFYCLGFGLFAD